MPLAGCFTFLFYSFLSLFSLREIYSPFPGLRRGVFSWRNHIGLDERQKKRRREELSVFCISFVCFMSRLLFFSSVLLCTTPRHHLKRSTSFPTMKATVCNSLVLPRLPCFLINCVHCGWSALVVIRKSTKQGRGKTNYCALNCLNNFDLVLFLFPWMYHVFDIMLFCGLNLAGKGRGKKKKGPIFKSKLTLPLNLTRFCLPPTIGLAHGQTCCARPAVWCRFNFPSPLPPPSLRFAEIRSWGNCRISGGEIIRWGFGVLHEKKGELFKVLFFF